MDKSNYHKYLLSDEWKSLKVDILQKRGCKCEICQKKKHPASLQIHHLHYENIFNELPTDLLVVCRKCHMREHGLLKPKKVHINKAKKTKMYKGMSRRDKALQKRYDKHKY